MRLHEKAFLVVAIEKEAFRLLSSTVANFKMIVDGEEFGLVKTWVNDISMNKLYCFSSSNSKKPSAFIGVNLISFINEATVR